MGPGGAPAPPERLVATRPAGTAPHPALTTPRESAELEAINLASTFAKDGRRAEVQVVEPGKKNHIVWQSAEQSTLGRAAALINH